MHILSAQLNAKPVKDKAQVLSLCVVPSSFNIMKGYCMEEALDFICVASETDGQRDVY